MNEPLFLGLAYNPTMHEIPDERVIFCDIHPPVTKRLANGIPTITNLTLQPSSSELRQSSLQPRSYALALGKI